MAITLNQIPGFADLTDAIFAAEQYAIGLNFMRTVENAKFGVVRPEVFYGKYINSDTVPLPVSPVDGYTYTRDELTYIWSWTLTGGTGASANGTPSQGGAIRYMASGVDQTTGDVSSTVCYLVGNGSGSTVSNDGTLAVFTVAIRRKTSMVMSKPATYTPVLDTECAADAPITESLMQRINQNAKFAAVRSEVIYMGEFVDGGTMPQPVSPVDGYQYSYAEVQTMGSWRWTTQGDSLTDPTNPNYKQLQNILWSVDNAGGVHITVHYYNSVDYQTNNGRIALFAFCQRTIPNGGLGAGAVDFVDLDSSFLASTRPVRYDVLQHAVRNTRFSMLRREFFTTTHNHGATVPLPVSPVDGYQYSREELTYIYNYKDTGIPTSSVRFYSWNCSVDQSTGLVTSIITRCANGGAAVVTNDGLVQVLTIARRGHVAADDDIFDGSTGGAGADDISALQNGGFDQWNNAASETADLWSIEQQSGDGYGSKVPGLVSGNSQRIGNELGGYFSIMSNTVSAVSGDLRFFSYITKPSVAQANGLTVIFHLYSPVGDECSFKVVDNGAVAADETQTSMWLQLPKKGDTTVQTNAPAMAGGTVPIIGALDFVPTVVRVEILYNGAAGSYVDFDEVTYISQTDPSIGQVAQRGSDSLAFFPAIPFTVSSTVFTPDLTFDINRVDGSITPVTDGNVPVTGLTPATAYNWYPYLNESTGKSDAVSTGGVGTPPWLQTTPTRDLFVAWYAINNLPYAASPIEVTTVAAGSPPGGGSGGGDGACLHCSMLVKEQTRGFITVSQLHVGDAVLGEGGRYLKVLEVEAKPHRDWIDIEFNHGGKLLVTDSHPFTQADSKELVRARDLTLSHMLLWTEGACHAVTLRYMKTLGTKVKVTLEDPHTFYAGDRVDRLTLTHNQLPIGIT